MDLLSEVPPPPGVETSEDDAKAIEATENMFQIYRRLCQSQEETTSLLPRYFLLGG